MFDLTDRKSYKNIGRWVNEVKHYSENNCILIMVGNKADQCPSSNLDPKMIEKLKLNEKNPKRTMQPIVEEDDDDYNSELQSFDDDSHNFGT